WEPITGVSSSHPRSLAMRLGHTGQGAPPRHAVSVALGMACLALGAVAASLAHDRIFHGGPSRTAIAPPPPSPEAGAPSALTTVTLTEGKIKAAGIQVGTARTEVLPIEVAVAGTIEPNPNRRVDIRPRSTGIV